MGPRSLASLQQLQTVETHLRSLKDMLRRKERQLEQNRLRIQQIEEQLLAKKEEIRHRQSFSGQMELELRARDSTISKLQSQLNTAKSNKEYSAILTQLNTQRASNSKQEEKILQVLGEVDEMKKAFGELGEELQRQQELLGKHESDFEAERVELVDQISKLEEDRERVGADVSPSDLAIFQRVADRHDGEATAQIIKPKPKQEEYICGGCNMSIPVETVNALLTRDELQECHICGRILYLETENTTGR